MTEKEVITPKSGSHWLNEKTKEEVKFLYSATYEDEQDSPGETVYAFQKLADMSIHVLDADRFRIGFKEIQPADYIVVFIGKSQGEYHRYKFYVPAGEKEIELLQSFLKAKYTGDMYSLSEGDDYPKMIFEYSPATPTGKLFGMIERRYETDKNADD